MERLARQIQEAQKLLQMPDADWKACSDAMEELAVAVEVMGEADSKKEAVKLLTGISREIGLQINSIRSRQARDACESLLRVVVATGGDFQELANALLPQIVNTAKNSSAAVRQPGSRLLSKISELVRYDLTLLRKIFVQQTQDRVRDLLLDQLMIVLVYWSDEEVLARETDMLKMIQRGLDDQSAKVRKGAREVLTRFSTRWSERVDEWVDMPSNQAKALLISDHRDSPLAQAILNKYPELAKKADPLSQSRASFSQSRSGLRKSQRHKREQNIEIHVSATPPPKQRDEQEAVSQSSSSADVAGNASIEKGAGSRRLFDDANLSDDDELENVVAAFDGSQMYGFTAKPTKEETVESFDPEVGQVPSPPAVAAPSRVAVPRSSSASSVEGVSLRHPGIRKLQESKIPKSPLNRSPSLLSKKYLDSPTGYSSSPELRPSRLPRPGSFTLKSRGSSGASTPMAVVNSGDERGDINPLSASDEYFSKPIPSSIATPTPPPPSTDNVTMRPRRRAFIHDEQERSPLQAYSPELQPPAQNELTRPQQDQFEPDMVISNPFETDVGSRSLEEPFADYEFDDAGDINHLTEGSAHDDSDKEWSRRQQHTFQSGSDVQEGGGQPSPSGEDVFPDEWRLDEGPRHKFEFADELGDHFSDDQAGAVDEVEDEDISITNGEEGEDSTWHEHGKSPLEEHVSELSDVEDEDKPATDAKSEDSPKDALAGLLGVRAEMTRLRAITRNEENSCERSLKERYASSGTAFDTADTANEFQKSPKHDVQEGAKPRSMEPSYFERLTHADRFSRSPLFTPPIAAPHELSKESELRGERSRSPSPAQSDEHEVGEAGTGDAAYEGLEEFNFLGQEHALPVPDSPHMLEHASARVDEHEPFDFVKEFHAGDGFRPHAETYSPKRQQSAQDDFITEEFRPGDAFERHVESYSPKPQQSAEDSFAAHEQGGRFDAAEKLFAAKEAALTHGFYGRPPAVDADEYSYPETYQGRVPPTPLGPKLNPAFATGQGNRGDAVPKGLNADAEADSNAGAANAQATPTLSAEQTLEERPSKLQWQKPEVAETVKTSAPTKHTARPLEPEKAARPPAAPETRAEPAKLGWLSSCGITFAVFLAAVFCIAGILHGARTVNESREYHAALQSRIDSFEASIAESHKKVLKLEEDYAVWSEYVRKLTEEDEKHALTQLEAIQGEVHKWQQDMKADLVQFRQALSVDAIESAFAAMRVNSTPQMEN